MVESPMMLMLRPCLGGVASLSTYVVVSPTPTEIRDDPKIDVTVLSYQLMLVLEG